MRDAIFEHARIRKGIIETSGTEHGESFFARKQCFVPVGVEIAADDYRLYRRHQPALQVLDVRRDLLDSQLTLQDIELGLNLVVSSCQIALEGNGVEADDSDYCAVCCST